MAIALSSEQVIRRLYQITNEYHKGFEHQIIQLLQMGLDNFGLDIGILSKIEQDDYVVKHCVTPENISMQPEDRFDFHATYCSMTSAAKEPVVSEHVGKDAKFSMHPAYKAFGLESYIGIPIKLNGELYGTLNFSSPVPLQRKFRDVDIDVLQLMASWIEGELIRKEQETKLKSLNEELEYQANYDSLTNILNRRGAYKNLQKSLNQLNRKSGECILAIIDIDYLKKINDAYGHQVGDEAIVSVVNQITKSIRDYEFVSRIGGDEFILWLPDTNQAGSTVVFERIMQHIGQLSTTLSQAILEPITVSIGACHFHFKTKEPRDLTKLIDTLMIKADDALYEAKNQGRNRFVYHQ